MTAAIRLWLVRIALLVPAVLIVTAAIPRLGSGAALEAAFPATAYIGTNAPLPQSSYRAIADTLSRAASDDGETMILRSEAAVDGGQSPATVIPIVRSALLRAPSTARGWILLAALLRDRDPESAAACLSLAVELAPREYYLISPRALVGASLWNDLPAGVRSRLVADARLMITTPQLHDQLRALLGVRGGPALVTRAFAGHPDRLREFNRTLASEKLGL